MEEIWKHIVDPVIQDRYLISNLGRVFDEKLSKYLNFTDNGAGYKIYGLQRKDKSNVAIRYVHRLVAIAFIENPEGKPQVGHRDHNRSHNVVENLYWTTQRENTQDGIEAGRINAKKRPNTKKLTKEQICEIALLEHQGFGVNEIAVRLDFSRTTISSVFNGRSNAELFEFARQEIAETNKQFPQNQLDNQTKTCQYAHT